MDKDRVIEIEHSEKKRERERNGDIDRQTCLEEEKWREII